MTARTTTGGAADPTRSRRRWLMLVLGLTTQAATFVGIYGVPYLVPDLRAERGLDLTGAGLLVACPTLGLVLGLVAWGAATDRFGERKVLGLGVGLCAACAFGAAFAPGVVPLGLLLVLVGATGASVSAASGRVVLGWFAADERGFAMGLRQTATPLGMGVAAFALPRLAGAYGLRGAFVFAGALCGVTALLAFLLVVDPARPAPADPARPPRSPYRTAALWRIHAASALLVMPQFAVGAFALVFLVDVRHWTPVHAGQLLAVVSLLGVAARIGAGRWSDRVGSRLRPMRQLACVNAAVVATLGLCAALPSWATAPVLVAAGVVSASSNSLAFTAVAELAGPAWAGRALGVQNTGQNVVASATPPALGALITGLGGGGPAYAAAFWLAAAFALAAAPTTPAARRG